MFDFLGSLFDTSGFPPRWQCGSWSRGHGWLHIVSDLGVWSAYVAIPCVLVYFAAKRRDVPFRTIFWLFGAFILACGTTHLMEAIIFWWPAYRLAGAIKLTTALVSWGTVLALVPVTPLALALRSPAELEREVAERSKAEAELRGMQAELERRVEQRTAELAVANAALQTELTERRRAEETLKREREWFRVTLQSIGDAVVVTDTQGRVTFFNHVARDLAGWSDADLGQALHDVFQIVNEHSRQRADDPVARVLATGVICGLANSTVLISTDGTERPIDDSASPIRTEQGELLGVVLVFRDVSERKQAEEATRDADRRKDEFLAMLGHELRNPLAGIAGAVQVLEAIGSKQAEANDMRSIIARQTDHMCRIVDDLLEISRISLGKLQIRPERGDVSALVRRTAEDFRRHLQARQVALQVNVPEQPVWADVDVTRLAQVLMNLLHNASKFTSVGGEVVVTLVEEVHDDCLALSVRDSGIGMAPEIIEHIFSPFRQVSSGSHTDGSAGLGLGLAVAKGLIELHGGNIRAESEGLGRGSTLIVQLPRVRQANGTPAQREESAPAGPSYRVLIIDDSRDAAYPLQLLLSHLGHEVHLVGDGPAGLEAARRLQPDVVLCDIGLPGGMDGYAVARTLRADRQTPQAYLVAVTGFGQETDRRCALESGFDQHLTKPVDLAELKVLLSSVVRPSA